MSCDRPSPVVPPGLWILPLVRGHSPPSTLNRLLLPDPLGPVTSRLVPAGTLRFKSRTRVASAGVTTMASSKAMASSDGTMTPVGSMAPSRFTAQHLRLTSGKDLSRKCTTFTVRVTARQHSKALEMQYPSLAYLQHAVSNQQQGAVTKQ